MVELKERTHGLLETYEAREKELVESGPRALREMRKEAARKFAEAGVPTVRHEEWKYTSLRRLAGAKYHSAAPAELSKADINSTPGGKIDGPRLVFSNGWFVAEHSNTDGVPKGVRFQSLQKALDERPDEVLAHLGKVATLEGRLGSFNDERFVWLNTAHLVDGAYLFVPKNVHIEPLIQIVYFAREELGEVNAHPRTLIVLEEGASARVVETYFGPDEDRYFTNPVTEIRLGKSARLEHTRIQMEAPGAFHIGILASSQDSGSTFISNVGSFGSKLCRLDVWSHVGGEHCETSLNGVYVGSGEQLLDHHTRIDHAMPNCHSFEVYKGILADHAQGVFNGKIFVYQDAQKTDAKQTNQALLLSRGAIVNTKPQLEIFADDVKCTHGATVGRLREDAMFYLRSRGIPQAEARNLLIYAFAAEVFEKIEDKGLRAETERLLQKRLAAIKMEDLE